MKKYTRETEGPGRSNPERLSGTWVQDKGRKGGDKWMSNNRRCEHAARRADTSRRDWRGARLDGIQVDGIPLRERMWEASETEIETTTNSY